MKLLILDKDGTLVKPKSGARFVQHPEDQELLPGVADAIARYAAEGWTMAIASNQGGVAAGYKTLDDAIAEMKFCLNLLPQIADSVFCPDDGKTLILCDRLDYLDISRHWEHLGGFRKPSPGMLKYHIMTRLATLADIRAGYPQESGYPALMVGDMERDRNAAENAGIDFIWAHDFCCRGVVFQLDPPD